MSSTPEIPSVPTKNTSVEYSADTYSFNDEKRSIEITRHDVPSAWINYLSNGRMHAFVSQAGGGYCWWKSPLLFRLTRYRMHHLPADSPGFYIYLRENEREIWSPTWRPCGQTPSKWKAEHLPGHTKFTASKNGMEATLTLFMAQDHDALVWDLRLKNTSGTVKQVNVFAYAELSQLNWLAEHVYGYYLKHMVKTWYDSEREALLYFYHFDGHSRLKDIPLVYFSATQPAVNFCGDRDAFMGPYRDERDPIAVRHGRLGNEELSSGEACAALQHFVEIPDGAEHRLSYFLGVAPGAIADHDAALAGVRQSLAALRAEGGVDREFRLLSQWWDKHLGVLGCVLPDKTAQRQIATWNPVNSVHAARYSRAINTFAPGGRGIGFRDSCQDMLAIAYRDPKWATETLNYLLTLQFETGNTLHVAHPEEPADPPDRVTRSDSHLWLPLLVHAIASETGDFRFLNHEVPFYEGGSASVWEHMGRAVKFTEGHLGAHGIPLTLHSDWNDSIGKFSRKGKGETVFAGQQYVYALRHLAALAKAIGDEESLEWFNDCRERQEAALLACAWDGQWWRRGFDDHTRPIGSSSNSFARLWLNPQSWAVLAGLGSREQREAGMRAVAAQLDTGIGLQLLTPGFKTWPEVEDPFSGYSPGTGENGAIFCHANTWAVIAEAMLGHGDQAWKYFLQMIPQNVIEKVGLERYQSEPYAWVSNIVGPESPRFGWGNISHITGTAAWMDVAACTHLLGMKMDLDGFHFQPCVPAAWDGFTVSRRCRGTLIHVEVENPDHVCSGVKRLEVEGVGFPCEQGAFIPAEEFAGRAEIRVKAFLGESNRKITTKQGTGVTGFLEENLPVEVSVK